MEKWILPNSSINDREKSIISGHYIFSNEEFIDLKRKFLKILKIKQG